MSKRATQLGYQYCSPTNQGEVKNNPPIRLKSVTKNKSLSQLINPTKIPIGSKQTLVNFDYLLFVFINPNDHTQLKTYITNLKSSKLLYTSNIIFFTNANHFSSLLEQVKLTTCHKRLALLIGQSGIQNYKKIFKEIHEIYVVVDSNEKYSKIKHLLNDKNMKAIIYDLGQVDRILMEINVIRSQSDIELLPSTVCRKSLVKNKESKDIHVIEEKINEINFQKEKLSKVEKISQFQSQPSNSKKNLSISQLGYYNKQNTYQDDSIESNTKSKHFQLPYYSTLKDIDQCQPVTTKVKQKQMFSEKSSNIVESQKLHHQQSSFESQIRKIALEKKSPAIQLKEVSVNKGKKSTASDWYKKYAIATNKRLGGHSNKDEVRQGETDDERTRTREFSSNYSSSNCNSGRNLFQNFRRDSNSQYEYRDEYQMTSHKWN